MSTKTETVEDILRENLDDIANRLRWVLRNSTNKLASMSRNELLRAIQSVHSVSVSLDCRNGKRNTETPSPKVEVGDDE